MAPTMQRVQVAKPDCNPEGFATLNVEARRQFVGNAVYPVISAALGDSLAGRVTGMIIDENVVDTKRLLTDVDYLNQQVNEAYLLLSM
jgi:hypothetical protein